MDLLLYQQASPTDEILMKHQNKAIFKDLKTYNLYCLQCFRLYNFTGVEFVGREQLLDVLL